MKNKTLGSKDRWGISERSMENEIRLREIALKLDLLELKRKQILGRIIQTGHFLHALETTIFVHQVMNPALKKKTCKLK